MSERQKIASADAGDARRECRVAGEGSGGVESRGHLRPTLYSPLSTLHSVRHSELGIPNSFQAGDLVVFSGWDFTSRVIEWATRGPSHVGIICPHGELGPLLFESTTLCEEPCVLAGKPVCGVQAHEPARRIALYRGTAAVARLAPAWKLSRAEVALLHDWLMHVASEPYDLRGALLSGTRLFKWTALMPYPDLGSLFCSELCAAALMRLHRMPLANPSAYSPASLVRELRRCGTYGAPVTVT